MLCRVKRSSRWAMGALLWCSAVYGMELPESHRAHTATTLWQRAWDFFGSKDVVQQKSYDAESVGSPWIMVPGYADLCYRELTGDSLTRFLAKTAFKHVYLFKEQWQKIVEVRSVSKNGNNRPRLWMYLFYQHVADQKFKNAMISISHVYELLEKPHGDTEFCYKDDFVRAYKGHQEHMAHQGGKL